MNKHQEYELIKKLENTAAFDEESAGLCILTRPFNLCSEKIRRLIIDGDEFIIGGHNISNIQYANGTTLMAESPRQLKRLFGVVV